MAGNLPHCAPNPQCSDETAGSQKEQFVKAQSVVVAELSLGGREGHVEFGKTVDLRR